MEALSLVDNIVILIEQLESRTFLLALVKKQHIRIPLTHTPSLGPFAHRRIPGDTPICPSHASAYTHAV